MKNKTHTIGDIKIQAYSNGSYGYWKEREGWAGWVNIPSELGKKLVDSVSLLSFEDCLREEFLVSTQNYPKEYHSLFNQKFERAEKRFKEQSGNDR